VFGQLELNELKSQKSLPPSEDVQDSALAVSRQALGEMRALVLSNIEDLQALAEG